MSIASPRALAAQRQAEARKRKVPRVIEQNYVDDLEEAGDDPEKIVKAYRRMYLAAMLFFHATAALDIRVLEAEQVRLVLAGRSDTELVARDQTLKFAARLNQQQMQAVNPEFMWVTMRDDRVREMHAALDGRVFRWDDPPITNPQGDRNVPGSDYECRCLPAPPPYPVARLPIPV